VRVDAVVLQHRPDLRCVWSFRRHCEGDRMKIFSPIFSLGAAPETPNASYPLATVDRASLTK
jgi:hypothetical protein